jgi:hypothetical protein
MSNKFLLIIMGLVAVLVAMTLALTMTASVFSDPHPTPTPDCFVIDCSKLNLTPHPEAPTVVPPEITDLYPDVPYEDKSWVYVQHPDGSKEAFLRPPADVDAFIAQLPVDDTLMFVAAPLSVFGVQPPTAPPEP